MAIRFAIIVCLMLGIAQFSSAAERLVVHEWGTFTSFQNEFGNRLRRINTDDEPVPPFVHRLSRIGLESPTGPYSVERFNSLTQGAPTADPRVTMRLETPVLYFHLPPGMKSVTLDVKVDFRNGFLTEFFPLADSTVNGKPVANYQFPEAAKPLGSLFWHRVRVGSTTGTMPDTTDHVWLAPRQVDAAPITVGNESERFLFYRGVGDVASPVRVIRHPDQILDLRLDSQALQLLDVTAQKLSIWASLTVQRQWWLLDVRRDGTSAFRRLPAGESHGQTPDRLCMASARFRDQDFSKDNLVVLRTQMHQALVDQGLFADEADGLLNTWELSYFQSPGQRLFYMVPQAWTDAVLPLKLSVNADIVRVMVGRIELVTPRQRELMQQIAETPVPDLTEVIGKMRALQQDSSRREAYNALASGRGDSSILGVPVPSIYQAFLDLGRFRTSLLMDSLERADQLDTHDLDRIRHLNFELSDPGKLTRE